MNFLNVTLMVFLCLGSHSVHAVQASLGYKKNKMDFMVYEVSQEKRFVRPGGKITAYWGDVIKFEKVTVDGPKQKFGYQIMESSLGGGREKPLMTLQGSTFDTYILLQKLMQQKDPVNPAAHQKIPSIFSIVLSITLEKKQIGLIPIELIFPQLQYLDIALNKKHRLVRDGESLLVKPSDQFKVHAIATNPSFQKEVFYQVVPEKDKVFLQLVRKNVLFATVVLDIER